MAIADDFFQQRKQANDELSAQIQPPPVGGVE
jgi:hypothetical protein